MKVLAIALIFMILFMSCSKGEEGNRDTSLPLELSREPSHDASVETEEAITEEPTAGIDELLLTHTTTANLRLRDSDDLDASIITVLNENTSLRIIETGRTDTIDGITAPWIRIISENGHIGWCFSGYVRQLDSYGFISFTNAAVTRSFSVPDINNIITGIDDGYPSMTLITENSFIYIWGGFQILLENDSPVDENLTVILRNQRHEFQRNLTVEELRIQGSNNVHYAVLGYYTNIYIENKPWLNDSTDTWRLIVTSDTGELLNEEFLFYDFSYLFFDRLDETPFIRNNLYSAEYNRQYTYRFKKSNADILVLYYSEDYYVYSPMLYLIPDESDSDFIDIHLTWNSDAPTGVYHMGQYKFDDMPSGERWYAVFDMIQLR